MKHEQRFNVVTDDVLSNCINQLTELSGILIKNGKSCEVIFGVHEKDRTILANSYLHGWIYRKQLMQKLNDAGLGITDEKSGEYFEWDVDLLKAYFTAPYFQDKIEGNKHIVVNGKPFRKPFHPSNLNAKKFGLYCDLVKDFACQKWGLVVEEPKGGKYREMYDQLKLGGR